MFMRTRVVGPCASLSGDEHDAGDHQHRAERSPGVDRLHGHVDEPEVVDGNRHEQVGANGESSKRTGADLVDEQQPAHDGERTNDSAEMCWFAAIRWMRQTSIWQVARRLRTTPCRVRVGNDLPTDVAKLERAIIREALDYRGGSKADAAGRLHIRRQPDAKASANPTPVVGKGDR